jgi:hypothetical protein
MLAAIACNRIRNWPVNESGVDEVFSVDKRNRAKLKTQDDGTPYCKRNR